MIPSAQGYRVIIRLISLRTHNEHRTVRSAQGHNETYPADWMALRAQTSLEMQDEYTGTEGGLMLGCTNFQSEWTKW